MSKEKKTKKKQVEAAEQGAEQICLSDMSELEARMLLTQGTKKPMSAKVSTELKEAFRQAAILEGYGTVNNAINTVMTDLVMKHRAEIKLGI